MKTISCVSSRNSGDQQQAKINVANLIAGENVYSADVDIPANDAAVRMFIGKTTYHRDMVESLLNDDVSLCSRRNALAAMDTTDNDHLVGVEDVPSGSGELARLEDEEYSSVNPWSLSVSTRHEYSTCID